MLVLSVAIAPSITFFGHCVTDWRNRLTTSATALWRSVSAAGMARISASNAANNESMRSFASLTTVGAASALTSFSSSFSTTGNGSLVVSAADAGVATNFTASASNATGNSTGADSVSGSLSNTSGVVSANVATDSLKSPTVASSDNATTASLSGVTVGAPLLDSA